MTTITALMIIGLTTILLLVAGFVLGYRAGQKR
jgi:hypothetical protein